MAVVLIEGFDFFTPAQAPREVPGRFDGKSALPPAGYFARSLPSTYTELYAGFAFRPGSRQVSDIYALRDSGTNNVCRVRVVASGSDFVLALLNSGGTVIATGTTKLFDNVWHYIEIHCLINGASGSCAMRLDGVAGEIPDTTGNFGTNAITAIAINGVNNTGSNFDDMYVVDTTGSAPRNTYLGDVRIETLFPTSDGAHSQWAPNSGTTHFSRVNETTPDDE